MMELSIDQMWISHCFTYLETLVWCSFESSVKDKMIRCEVNRLRKLLCGD